MSAPETREARKERKPGNKRGGYPGTHPNNHQQTDRVRRSASFFAATHGFQGLPLPSRLPAFTGPALGWSHAMHGRSMERPYAFLPSRSATAFIRSWLIIHCCGRLARLLTA